MLAGAPTLAGLRWTRIRRLRFGGRPGSPVEFDRGSEALSQIRISTQEGKPPMIDAIFAWIVSTRLKVGMAIVILPG